MQLSSIIVSGEVLPLRCNFMNDILSFIVWNGNLLSVPLNRRTFLLKEIF